MTYFYQFRRPGQYTNPNSRKRELKARRKVQIVEERSGPQEMSSPSVINLSRCSRKTRGLGKKTIEKHTKINSDPSLTVLKEKTETVKNLACKCSKSKCLKMYCECFT